MNHTDGPRQSFYFYTLYFKSSVSANHINYSTVSLRTTALTLSCSLSGLTVVPHEPVLHLRKRHESPHKKKKNYTIQITTHITQVGSLNLNQTGKNWAPPLTPRPWQQLSGLTYVQLLFMLNLSPLYSFEYFYYLRPSPAAAPPRACTLSFTAHCGGSAHTVPTSHE